MHKVLIMQTAAQMVTGAAMAAPPAISLDTLKDVTRTLSSDEFEGRAPTTSAEDKTIGYLAGRFGAAGLKPGNGDSWFQNVPIVELNADPRMALTVTGGKAPRTLAYKTDMVAFGYRIAPKTEIKDSELVFVGYGIRAPELGWNDYAGLDVKGKTVVILINDPDYAAKDMKGQFGGRAMTYYGRWTYKFEEAARQGAAAAIIIHDTYPAAYPWDVVVSSWTGPQVRMDAEDGHKDQTLANAWITMDAAKALFGDAGTDLAALSAKAVKKGFKAVPLGLKASLAFTHAPPLDLQAADLIKRLIEQFAEGPLQPVEVLRVRALICFRPRGIIAFKECGQGRHRHLGLARFDRIDAQIDIGKDCPRTGARLAQSQNVCTSEEYPSPARKLPIPRLDPGRHDPKHQSLEPHIAIIDAGCRGVCFVYQLLGQRGNHICPATSCFGPNLVVHWWCKSMKRAATQ